MSALSRAVRTPRMLLVAAAAAVVVALAVLPFLGTSLIPSFKDRDVLVHLDSEPGTSNPRMTRITTQVSRELRQVPGVEDVGAPRRARRDGRPDRRRQLQRGMGRGSTPARSTTKRWRRSKTRSPGLAGSSATSSPIRPRRSGTSAHSEEGDNPVSGDGLDVLTGARQPLVVRVYGQDLDVLRARGEEAAAARRRGRRRRRPANREPSDAADRRDRGRSRASAEPGDQAGRRAPGGGRRCCRASRWAASSRSRRCST